MARPTPAKEAKPKAEEGAEQEGQESPAKAPLPFLNLIITAVVIIFSTSLASAASMYFLAPMILKPIIVEAASAHAEGGEEGGEGEEGEEGEGGGHASVGPVLSLEEFTVNLKDADKDRYLRAAFSITVATEDPEFEKLAGEALHKWQEEFHLEMGTYVPAIRDIVISSLTKHTAAELSTAIGKQEVKEEIQRNTDALFQGKHKVIRVNIENFIIQ